MLNAIRCFLMFFSLSNTIVTICFSKSVDFIENWPDKTQAFDRNKEFSIKDHLVYQELSKSTTTSENLKLDNEAYHISNRQHANQTHSGQKKKFDELLVNTQNGYVRGKAVYAEYLTTLSLKSQKIKSKKKHRLNAWLGIPYAEKPVGDLRFKRPVPIKKWDGIFNASELPNSCYQLPDTVIPDFLGVEMWNANTNVSEDCLYLNIWTPHPKPQNAPVMVWIYGGSFLSGTSTLKIYDPKVIVAETGVIFVSLNYRLSIFGFLYMDHMNAPGNQGLLDQYVAMSWIHNNIQFFGGDSSKITLFGESAGSASVSLHLLSRLSHNLFRNAIMQSGTALSDWASLKNSIAIKRYSEILQELGCNGTTAQMIECAKKVDPKTAIEKSDEYFYSRAVHGIMQFPFLPVVDNYFLEDEPINLMNRGNFKKCPIIVGTNKDEGNWFYVYAFSEYRNLTIEPQLDYDTYKSFLTSLFHFYPQFPAIVSKSALNAIIYRYTNWQNVHNSKTNMEGLDDAATDFHFICPSQDFASLFSFYNQDVYFYYFTQRSSMHYWPEWLGVMHGDEISFVFGEPLLPEFNFTESERTLSRKLLKYWSNFARYNNPNGPQQQQYINEKNNLNASLSASLRQQNVEHWPKYQVLFNSTHNHQKAYLILDADKVEVKHNLRADYCGFWGSFLANILLSESQCNSGCAGCSRSVLSSFTSSAANTIIRSRNNHKIFKTVFIFLFLNRYIFILN